MKLTDLDLSVEPSWRSNGQSAITLEDYMVANTSKPNITDGFDRTFGPVSQSHPMRVGVSIDQISNTITSTIFLLELIFRFFERTQRSSQIRNGTPNSMILSRNTCPIMFLATSAVPGNYTSTYLKMPKMPLPYCHKTAWISRTMFPTSRLTSTGPRSTKLAIAIFHE